MTLDVATLVGVRVGVGVWMNRIAVCDTVGLATTCVTVGVATSRGVRVAVGVVVAVVVLVAVRLAVAVGDGVDVFVGVDVGVGVTCCAWVTSSGSARKLATASTSRRHSSAARVITGSAECHPSLSLSSPKTLSAAAVGCSA